MTTRLPCPTLPRRLAGSGFVLACLLWLGAAVKTDSNEARVVAIALSCAMAVLGARAFRARIECDGEELRFSGILRSRAYARHGITAIIPTRYLGSTVSAITVFGVKRPIVLPLLVQPVSEERRFQLHAYVHDWLSPAHSDG